MNFATTNNLLYAISRFIDAFGRCTECNTIHEMRTSYLYLLYAYYWVGFKQKEAFWMKNALELYDNYTKQLPGLQMDNPFGYYIYQRLLEITGNKKLKKYSYVQTVTKPPEVFTIFNLIADLYEPATAIWQEGWLIK